MKVEDDTIKLDRRNSSDGDSKGATTGRFFLSRKHMIGSKNETESQSHFISLVKSFISRAIF